MSRFREHYCRLNRNCNLISFSALFPTWQRDPSRDSSWSKLGSWRDFLTRGFKRMAVRNGTPPFFAI